MTARSVANSIASAIASSASGVGDGGDSGMPTGAIGLYYPADYVATPRAYIPNRMEATPTPLNLLNATNRLFNNTRYYSPNLLTIVDDVTDRNSGTNASNLTSSGTGWYLIRTLTTIAAGTYTVACYAKRNSGSDQSWKFYAPGSPGTLTATSSWTRFSYTFSHPGGSLGIGFNSTGVNSAITVSDFELYSGSSDLGPEAIEAGHLFLDKSAGDVFHTRSGNVLSLTAAGSHGFIQFPTGISTDQISVVALVRKVSASTGYVNSLSKIQSASAFSTRLEIAGIPGFGIGTEFERTAVFRSAGWDLTGRGWLTFAHTASGNTRKLFFDQVKLDTSTNAVTPTTIRDLYVSSFEGVYGEGYEWGCLAIWDRALTDAEVIAAQRAMLATSGLTRGTVRYLIAGGDSLSGGDDGHPNLFLANDSPTVLFTIYSLNGGTLDDVVPLMTDKIPTSKVSGSKYIVSLMVTNGLQAVTAEEYLDQLLIAVRDFKSDHGALVALGTIPPRSDAGNPGFNAKRATVNTEIRTWLGVECDAIYDFAADPTVGTDAAGNNATYYPDGTHPTASVQSTYFEPLYRAAINSL